VTIIGGLLQLLATPKWRGEEEGKEKSGGGGRKRPSWTAFISPDQNASLKGKGNIEGNGNWAQWKIPSGRFKKSPTWGGTVRGGEKEEG